MQVPSARTGVAEREHSLLQAGRESLSSASEAPCQGKNCAKLLTSRGPRIYPHDGANGPLGGTAPKYASTVSVSDVPIRVALPGLGNLYNLLGDEFGNGVGAVEPAKCICHASEIMGGRWFRYSRQEPSTKLRRYRRSRYAHFEQGAGTTISSQAAHPRRGAARRRQHRQAIDAASTQHRLSLRRSLRMRPSKDSVSIPSYRLPLFADNRRLLMSSGATGPRRPSLKSRLEISHEERSIH
jgi:hypothetical protein